MFNILDKVRTMILLLFFFLFRYFKISCILNIMMRFPHSKTWIKNVSFVFNCHNCIVIKQSKLYTHYTNKNETSENIFNYNEWYLNGFIQKDLKRTNKVIIVCCFFFYIKFIPHVTNYVFIWNSVFKVYLIN